MPHSRPERFHKIFLFYNTFFSNIAFVSFSISSATCLFITLGSVIASVILLLWQLVNLVATFQVILGCEICLSIRHSHSTGIIQCVSEVKLTTALDNGILCARWISSVSLRWREMGTRRFWAVWEAVASAQWGRDGGTSRWASVG